MAEKELVGFLVAIVPRRYMQRIKAEMFLAMTTAMSKLNTHWEIQIADELSKNCQI